MKFKTSAIALAVAGIVSAPMIASAEGSFYASARYGFSMADSDVAGEDAVNSFHNFGSRIGLKGSTDLGNGMTAYSQWEAHLFGGALRDFKVGVKGGFGDIYMGDGINHAWDSVMSTDGTWWYGGTMHLSDGVQSNAITYSGGAGDVSLAATIQMSGPEDDGATPPVVTAAQEDIDTTEVVASFDVGDITLAVGITDSETAETITGLLAKGSAGDINWAFDYQTQDALGDDSTSTQIEVGMGPFMAQYGMQEVGGVEPSALVLTYTKSLGPDTLMYFEYITTDTDTGTDPTTLGVVLKHNIL